jgi:hypothetical protein
MHQCGAPDKVLYLVGLDAADKMPALGRKCCVLLIEQAGAVLAKVVDTRLNGLGDLRQTNSLAYRNNRDL